MRMYAVKRLHIINNEVCEETLLESVFATLDEAKHFIIKNEMDDVWYDYYRMNSMPAKEVEVLCRVFDINEEQLYFTNTETNDKFKWEIIKK